jgi:hypothetical protein
VPLLLSNSHNLLRQRRRASAGFLALIILTSFGLSACDPEGKKDCAWTLEPEIKLEGTTDPGYIPVCARNRKTEKQDCRLQATVEFAKKIYGKKFRYVDMVIESPGLPRTVTDIKLCDE